MNLIKCTQGHFYNGDSFDKCPYCFPLQVPVPNPESQVQSASSNDLKSNMPGIKEDAPYVFISYAHMDSPQVLDIVEYLRENHFNVWYDEGIRSGHEWADEISRRIKHCKQFICFLSHNSVNSESVKDEIHIAWKYNINTVVVYLEKLELDGGLEMKLDRKQAILKYALGEDEFCKKLCSSITQDAVQIANSNSVEDVRLLDRYEIKRTLSKGGTASTYLAKNKMTGVYVVLKHGTYDDTVSGRRIKRSFEREREVLSKNISPFIPTLYDYFYDDHNVYLAESFIEGKSIGEIADIPLEDKIRNFINIAKVIKKLHNKGIYHCDIKPEHIVVNNHGCFLIDFGSAEGLSTNTDEDVKMGTVAYAAPEQFESYNGEDDMFGNYRDSASYSEAEKRIDERTDIYALGRVIVKNISNSRADDLDEDVTTVLFANATRTIEVFSEDPLLQAIVEKMLREKKSNRYGNMDEVIKVLEDYLRLRG